MAESNPLTCPKCNHTDQIQKLSSIVSQGTRKTTGVSTTSGVTDISGSQEFYSYTRGEHDESKSHHYSGKGLLKGQAYSINTSTFNSLEQTDLAKRLSFLPKPSPPRNPQISLLDKYDNLKITTILIFGIIFSLPGMELERYLPSIDITMDNVYIMNVTQAILQVVGLVIGLIIGNKAITWFRTTRPFVSPASKKKAQFEVQQVQYLSEIENWEKAYSNWNKLYYCFRDDIVFMPDSLKISSPEKTLEFCYEETS